MRGFRQMMGQMLSGSPSVGAGARDLFGRPMQAAAAPGAPQFRRDQVGNYGAPYPGYGQMGADVVMTDQQLSLMGPPAGSPGFVAQGLDPRLVGLAGAAPFGVPAGVVPGPTIPGFSGCIPPLYPIRPVDRFCPMVIPLDTESKVIPGRKGTACAGASVTFDVEVDCIFRLCTLRIPSNAAQCLVVDSIIIRKTEQLGCGGPGEGSISGTFFSELATCCYCIACDLAWPSDRIKVTVRNLGNADIGDSETGCGQPGLIALVGEGLDFSQCAGAFLPG